MICLSNLRKRPTNSFCNPHKTAVKTQKDKQARRQKGKKAKRQQDKKAKRQEGRKVKRQKDNKTKRQKCRQTQANAGGTKAKKKTETNQ